MIDDAAWWKRHRSTRVIDMWQAYFFEIAARHAPWQVTGAANVMLVTDPAQK